MTLINLHSGTQDSATIFCPAKINLFLHINARFDNGYHSIQTVLRAIDFFDKITIQKSTHFSLDGNFDCAVQDNLIYKAYIAICAHARQDLPIKISVHKHIPTGAGLGGGSSNAAAMLVALNILFNLQLTRTQLMALGVALGADVPFFIGVFLGNPCACATGIGEKLTPIKLPPRQYLVLLPNAHASTHTLFTHLDTQKNTPILPLYPTHFLDNLAPHFHNAFEKPACQNPAIKEALAYLRTLPSNTHARLTGTGAAVFLPILAHTDTDIITTWQQNAPCPAILANSL